MWCIWIGVFGICVGTHLEYDYRDRVAQLPALVDEHGNTASLEIAMAGLDSYEHAKTLRQIGFGSFGLGALLCMAGIFTTSQRVRHEPVA
jgi:hypothetical protein